MRARRFAWILPLLLLGALPAGAQSRAGSRALQGEVEGVDRAGRSFRLCVEPSGVQSAATTRRFQVLWTSTTRFRCDGGPCLPGAGRAPGGPAAAALRAAQRPGATVRVTGRPYGRSVILASDVAIEQAPAAPPAPVQALAPFPVAADEPSRAGGPTAAASTASTVPPSSSSLPPFLGWIGLAAMAAGVAALGLTFRRGRAAIAGTAAPAAAPASDATVAGPGELALGTSPTVIGPAGAFAGSHSETLQLLVAPYAEEPAPSAPADTRPRSVLLVDDDPDIRLVVAGSLRSHGYEVVQASTGAEALERVQSWTPDVIVTDVMMPEMNGWTLVKQLRAQPRFALVPVIFLTMLGDSSDRMKGFRLGADDYLIKTQFADLKEHIDAALERRARLEAVLHGSTHPAPAARPRGLGGSLDQLGLPSLLSLLEQESRSGELWLAPPGGGPRLRIALSEGRALAAGFEGGGGPRNADAIHDALTWEKGEFEFLPGPVADADEIGMPIMHLLLEGARLQDERERERALSG